MKSLMFALVIILSVNPSETENKPLSKSHWSYGSGIGSKSHWNYGSGLGSKSHWNYGSGYGSKSHWKYGSGEGSEAHWKYGSGLGSKSHWKYGSGEGSEAHWKYGSGQGSISHWNYGSGVTFKEDKLIDVYIGLLTNDQAIPKGFDDFMETILVEYPYIKEIISDLK